MILLYEAPEGFALFKVLDEGKLSNVEDLGKVFSSPDSARKMVRLIDFHKLTSEEALDAATKLMKGTPSKDLLYFLKLYCHREALAVADSKLGHAIRNKLKIDIVHNNAVLELVRGVRSQFPELVSGVDDLDLARPIGLSHSLARYKLTEKREPEPDNTMGLKYLDMLEVRFKKLDNVEEAEEETLMYSEEHITAPDSLPDDSEEPFTAADSLPRQTPEDSEKLITAAQTPKVSKEPSKKKYKKNYNVENAEEELKGLRALIEEVYKKDKKKKKMEEEEPEEEPSKKKKVEEPEEEDELTSWALGLINKTYNTAADSLLGQTPAKSVDCEEPSKKMAEDEEPEKVEPAKKKENAEEE